MCHLVAVAGIPHKALLVARHRQVVGEEPVVGLILSAHVGKHLPLWERRLRMEYHDARHRVGAVHQRGRSLQDLY